MKTCYYAHCMSLYGSEQEKRDNATIRDLGFQLVTPNTEAIHLAVLRLRASGDILARGHGYESVSDRVMVEIFKPLAQSCDVLAFRALPDGAIPSGVAKEIQWAIEAHKTIIELPTSILRRTLSLELTREYLRMAGQR